jgi:hypothetical protein
MKNYEEILVMIISFRKATMDKILRQISKNTTHKADIFNYNASKKYSDYG